MDRATQPEGLQYPNMRDELVGYLEDLARADCSPDSFDYAVHFLFDDTPLDHEPEKALGLFLRSSAELEAVRAVMQLVDQALERYETDEDLVGSPSFAAINGAAKTALAVLAAG